MNASTADINLREAVKNLDALPAMPVIAQKLLALQINTDEGEKELLMLIGQDPQISAKLIGLSNSVMYSASQKVVTVRGAATRLGLPQVQSISIGIAIMSLTSRERETKFRMQELWLHSFGVAFAMLAIARAMPAKIRPQDDQTFLIGMLHDIGYLTLAFLDPKRSHDLHACLAMEPDRPSLSIEWDMLDICHDELGSELARHWHLPNEIVTVLRYHHTPGLAEVEAGKSLVHIYMIHLAERLLPSFGIIECVDTTITASDWEILGIDPGRAEEISAQVSEQADQAMQFVRSFS